MTQDKTMTESSSVYFRQVAGEWDNLRSGYFGEALRAAAIEKAYLRPEMVVADVGAGTGFIAAGLAPLVRRVYVVDGSAEMLAVARQNLSGFANVEFHHADGLELPFPDESLDAVFANMYLHHCPDPLAAINEMVRVLRPGGRLMITDMDAHSYEWLKAEMADVWQGFARSDLRAWFAAAGLVNTVVDGSGQSCCAESKAGAASGEAETTEADCAEGDACLCSSTLTGKSGQVAEIGVFLATGTRRMAMRSAVEAAYSAVARSGSCGCGSAEVPTDAATLAGAAIPDGAATLLPPTSSACCSSSGSAGQACCGGASTSAEANAETAAAAQAVGGQYLPPDYTPEDVAGAPHEAAEIPLGCGNPVAIANLRPGEVVLDIGSGGGLDSFLSAGKVGPSGQVIGVDMTPAMLERARAAAERSGIGNVEFRQGLAEALPVEDGRVDVVISNCVINLSEDKGQVFREAFRVLKPGGRLEVSDIVAGAGLPIEARESASGWSECVTGALPEQEYVDLVAQAGFRDIRVRRSPASGSTAGVPIYSAYVSAVK